MERSTGLAIGLGATALLAAAAAVAWALTGDDTGPTGDLPPFPWGPSPSPSPSTPGPTAGTWPSDWSGRAAAIRALANRVEQVTNWPGLGDYLAATAYTESRGNPVVRAGTKANSATGLFQCRPKTCLVHEDELEAVQPMGGELLKDPALAVATAAWLAWRLRNFDSPGQTVDWLAIRRGWALPRLVSDVNETEQRSIDVRNRFSQGVARAGLPQSFMYQRAFPSGMRWPGIWTVMDAAGVDYGRLGINRWGGQTG